MISPVKEVVSTGEYPKRKLQLTILKKRTSEILMAVPEHYEHVEEEGHIIDEYA